MKKTTTLLTIVFMVAMATATAFAQGTAKIATLSVMPIGSDGMVRFVANYENTTTLPMQVSYVIYRMDTSLVVWGNFQVDNVNNMALGEFKLGQGFFTVGNEYVIEFTGALCQRDWIRFAFGYAPTAITRYSLDEMITVRPEGGELTVISGCDAPLSASVVTMTGQQVWSGTLEKGATRIPMQDSAHGVYVVTVTDGDKTATKKLLF